MRAIKRSNRKAESTVTVSFESRLINLRRFWAFLCVCVLKISKRVSSSTHNNDDTWQSSLNIQRSNISCSLERKRPQELLIKLNEVSNNFESHAGDPVKMRSKRDENQIGRRMTSAPKTLICWKWIYKDQKHIRCGSKPIHSVDRRRNRHRRLFFCIFQFYYYFHSKWAKEWSDSIR